MIYDIVSSWEKRAKMFGDTKRSVMQSDLPDIFNEYIHKIQLKEVIDFVPKTKCLCLDVGCGYGRLAQEITFVNKQAYIYGIDISSKFIDMFNKKLAEKGESQVANVKNLPFANNSFDFVISVAALMYLENKSDLDKSISEILRVMKKKGKLLIIEPNVLGYNIRTIWGILPFIYRNVFKKKKKVQTDGMSFAFGELDKLILKFGGKVISKRGYPFLTFSFIFLFALSKFGPFLANYTFKLINKLDEGFNNSRLSYLTVYRIEKI